MVRTSIYRKSTLVPAQQDVINIWDKCHKCSQRIWSEPGLARFSKMARCWSRHLVNPQTLVHAALYNEHSATNSSEIAHWEQSKEHRHEKLIQTNIKKVATEMHNSIQGNNRTLLVICYH